MAKEMGDVVRFEPASQPAWAAALVVVMAFIVVVNAFLFIWGIGAGWNDPIEDQVQLGIMLGNVFFGLALVMVLYRRFFVDDIMIVKKRHPKYEDFLEKYDID